VQRLCLAGALIAFTAGILAVRTPALTAAAVVAAAVSVLAWRNYEAAVGLFTALTFFVGAPGLAHTVSVVKLLTLVLIVVLAASIVEKRRRPILSRELPLTTLGILVLAIWAGSSAIWATDANAASSGAFRLLQMLVILFLVFAAIRNTGDLRLFAWSFIAGATLTALVPLLGLERGTAESGDRFGGFLGNPNNLAAVVLPALALTGFMLIGSNRRSERILLGGSGLVLLVTLFLTQSRGGYVGLGAMAVAAVVFAGPARRRALHLLIGLGLSMAAYFAFFASSAARQRATEISGSESTGRVDLWHVALRMFDAHPLQGVGLDNFTVLAPGYLANDVDIHRADLFLRSVATQVHNTYLTVLVELGVVGEVVFVGLLIAAVVTAIRAVAVLARSTDRQGELIGRGLLVGVVGMLAAYVFFSAQYEKQLWLILGALLSLSTLARAKAPAQASRSRNGDLLWRPCRVPHAEPVRPCDSDDVGAAGKPRRVQIVCVPRRLSREGDAVEPELDR